MGIKKDVPLVELSWDDPESDHSNSSVSCVLRINRQPSATERQKLYRGIRRIESRFILSQPANSKYGSETCPDGLNLLRGRGWATINVVHALEHLAAINATREMESRISLHGQRSAIIIQGEVSRLCHGCEDLTDGIQIVIKASEAEANGLIKLSIINAIRDAEYILGIRR